MSIKTRGLHGSQLTTPKVLFISKSIVLSIFHALKIHIYLNNKHRIHTSQGGHKGKVFILSNKINKGRVWKLVHILRHGNITAQATSWDPPFLSPPQPPLFYFPFLILWFSPLFPITTHRWSSLPPLSHPAHSCPHTRTHDMVWLCPKEKVYYPKEWRTMAGPNNNI